MKNPIYKGHDSLAEMVSTHISNWRSALNALKDRAESLGEDDSASHCDHELKALSEIEEACKAELAGGAQ